MIKQRRIILIAGLNFAVITAFLVSFTRLNFPQVGIDFRLFLTRILDTHLHYVINGFALQWFTPSFGGGLPAYANPLQAQFSLPQFLTLIIDPWKAVLASSTIYALIGFIVTFLLLKRCLVLNSQASILGAVFFTANGFFIEHLAIGHVNFITFPLIVIPLYALLEKDLQNWQAGMIISFVSAIYVYSGGVYIGVINIFVLLLSLPIVYFVKPSLFSWRNILAKSAIAIGFTSLLSLSKLLATFAFMKNFPRLVQDTFFVNWYTGLGGLVSQLLGVMNIVPILKILGKNSMVFVARLDEWTGTPYGFWELDTSLSPALIILLAMGAIWVLGKKPRFDRKKIRKDILAGIVLIIAVVLTTQFSLAKGFFFLWSSKVPILASLHANTRFASGFILPLSILAGVTFHYLQNKITSRIWKIGSFLSLDLLALVSIWSYFFLPLEIHQRGFEVQSIIDTYHQIEDGERFPVKTIISSMNDNEVIPRQASNMTNHYDPLFRDENQYFSPLLHNGSVYEVDGGYYNFTNPIGYIYPLQNQTFIYERFKLDDLARMNDFLNRRNFKWNVPWFQELADWISGITFLTIMFALIAFPLKKWRPSSKS